MRPGQFDLRGVERLDVALVTTDKAILRGFLEVARALGRHVTPERNRSG